MFTICNIYAPNDDNVDFFTNTMNAVEECANGHIIIAGDYNMVLNPDIDATGRTSNNQKAMNYVNNYMDEMNLCDIWRILNPDKQQYTWYRSKPSKCMSRLDYMITDLGLVNSVKNSKIENRIQSDHCLITLTLEAESYKRGPGSWRLNNSLLMRQEFVDEMKQHIEHTLDIYSNLTPTDKWEMVKSELINLCENQTASNVYANNCTHPANIVSLIVLIVKYYIFRCFCEGKKPNVHGMWHEIKLHKKLDLYNARIDSRELRMKAKWNQFNIPNPAC